MKFAERTVHSPWGSRSRRARVAGLVIFFSGLLLTAVIGSVQRYSMPGPPGSLIYDGAYLWAVDSYNDELIKVRPSDGVVVGTYDTDGPYPQFATFDGENIWVSNQDGNTVAKIRASDGTHLATYWSGGGGPTAIAFDGVNIWVTNTDQGAFVEKIRASDGTLLGNFNVGLGQFQMVFDGANIWVTSSYDGFVTKLRAIDGVNLGRFSVGKNPFGVTFDGTNIWVANYGDSTVSKLRASDGVLLGTFRPGGTGPLFCAWEGKHIWVSSTDRVTRLSANTGVLEKTYLIDHPSELAFDGTSTWISDSYFWNLYKIKRGKSIK